MILKLIFYKKFQTPKRIKELKQLIFEILDCNDFDLARVKLNKLFNLNNGCKSIFGYSMGSHNSLF